jgi:YVTN family beta-propeller protein
LHRTGKVSAGNQAGKQVRRAVGAGVFVIAALTAGCGATYRPVVSAINPVGPAGQPTKFAIAVSDPSFGNAAANTPGLVTIVDFSGDTVLATPSIQPNPNYFVLGNSGNTAYVVNAAGALDTFPVSNPVGLLTSNVDQTTLLANADPISITALAGTASGTTIFIPQLGRDSIAALSSNGPSLLQELAPPTGTTPNYVVGVDSAPRAYALSSAASGAGQAASIETTLSLPTISNTLTVGTNPVYGVMSPDASRAYILNKGDGTVSVINVQTNQLDLTTPTIGTEAAAPGTLALNPVWAVVVPTLVELVVLNQGDGVHPGSLSVVSIPLCNAVTPVTNPDCNQANPVDANGFGTVVATVPVGINPVMVDVLKDGSRAYVVNRGNAAAGVEGSVSVVNLQTNQVTATIAATSNAAATQDFDTSPTLVYGHPNSVSVSLASPTGKVYITSSDNKFMTVLRTDTDAVTTHITLQGLGLRVLVSAP